LTIISRRHNRPPLYTEPIPALDPASR
jgi:hypothetical protein